MRDAETINAIARLYARQHGLPLDKGVPAIVDGIQHAIRVLVKHEQEQDRSQKQSAVTPADLERPG